ncbi:uncharacterized protein BT62DRAFT_1012011 [Guyanagaster necrorhizus]|uniref:Uncharacterized protein n=1 Tax=Guyanagaster necrorhizus TaxID=856835 RepID=A0A9P8AMW8_9AGAR|nr:uncharacterized protein BT62DRAFT_1012011 [Guyanagaster necrorhizus MCA 3950]KAG7441199.1 hypothetical protein BT62DRAFT_1012011 [Guyanagaster necrorhizus MCA 3950]
MNPKVIVDDIAHRHAWASGRKGTTTSKSTLLAGCLPPCSCVFYDIVLVSILRQRIEFDIDVDTDSIRPKGLHPYQEVLIPRKLHPQTRFCLNLETLTTPKPVPAGFAISMGGRTDAEWSVNLICRRDHVSGAYP